MAIRLGDDGTMDTVLFCTECSKEFRFQFDPTDCDECGRTSVLECTHRNDFIADKLTEMETEHTHYMTPEEEGKYRKLFDYQVPWVLDASDLQIIHNMYGLTGDNYILEMLWKCAEGKTSTPESQRMPVEQRRCADCYNQFDTDDAFQWRCLQCDPPAMAKPTLRERLEQLSALALKMEDICSDLNQYDEDGIAGDIKVEVEALVADIQELL